MNKSIRIFGTDGIRQQMGVFPLDTTSIVKLGMAISQIFPKGKILIGRDTRESSPLIENLLAQGINPNSSRNSKHQVFSCGIIPTPGLSYCTDHGDFELGIMITASHNPYKDNGIKIFDRNGEKITKEKEEEIEDHFSKTELFVPENLSSSNLPSCKAKDFYYQFIHKHKQELLNPYKNKNFKIVIDCAHGATYELAPFIFKDIGFSVTLLNNQPNGKNINMRCGSTHLDPLREEVLKQKADLGIAFDGDGDRVLFIDKKGRTINGDYTLFLLAKLFIQLKKQINFNKVIVGTVMGNLGLERALKEYGMSYLRTQVGDKHVYNEMKCQDSILGGEQSGHTILRCFQKTGDGILTSLYFIYALLYLDVNTKKIYEQLSLYPQKIKNINIKQKRDLNQWDQLNHMISEFNREHGGNSRILLRYSGTEPKIRLMIESKNKEIIDENISKFETFLKSNLGV